MSGLGGFLIVIGLVAAGLGWLLLGIARRPLPPSPRASDARLAEAARSRNELSRFGPFLERVGLAVAALGLILLVAGALS